MGSNKTKIIIVTFFSITLVYWPFSICVAEDLPIKSDEVIKLVNESRHSEGLSPLLENPILDRIAGEKAGDMVSRNYFSHNSPKGLTPWYWFEKNNYSYEYAGENLAINYENAAEQHNAWMDSSKHRKNILNSNFLEIGVATVPIKVEGKESLLTVQEFGTPKGVAVPSPLSETNDIKNKLAYPLEPEITNRPIRTSAGNHRSLGVSKMSDESKSVVYENIYDIMIILMLAIAFTGPLLVVLSKIKKNRWEKADDITKIKVVTNWGEYLGFFKGIIEEKGV
jgi:hypothetical protein